MLLILGLAVLSAFQDNGVTLALAGVLSGSISGTVMYLTKRSGDQATVKVAETTTRGQVEEEAFKRAEAYYLTANEDRDRRLHDQADEIVKLKARVEFLEDRVEHAEAVADQAQEASRRDKQMARRMAKGLYDLRRGGVQAHPDPALDEAVIELLADDD